MLSALYQPIIDFFVATLSPMLLFGADIVIIILSFALFDRRLPQMTVKQSQFGRISKLVYRPWVMFLLGAAVTLLSMSVSISLGILVPLSQRGLIRRENIIPYILGANIATFVDTVLVALLRNNPDAMQVVMAEIVSMILISIILLVTIYHRYERWMLFAVSWSTKSMRNMFIALVGIFALPILLLLV